MLPNAGPVFYNGGIIRSIQVRGPDTRQDRDLNHHEDKHLRFRCPHCSAGLRGKLADAGKRRKCPQCHQTFRIPRPRVAGDEFPPAKKQLVPVVCSICQTRVYATLDQVGSLMECPDCYTQNLVKPPPKGATASFMTAETGLGYGLGPEADLNKHQSYAQEMIAGAELEVEQKIEEAPDVPRRPFLSGVFTFPFYWRVFPLVVGMTISLGPSLSTPGGSTWPEARHRLRPSLFEGTTVGATQMTIPPSTCSTAPVVNELASEAK